MTKKIKFASNGQKEFILELRQKVSDYFEKNNKSKYGNLNLWLKTVFMFSLFLVPYILMITGIISTFTPVLICWILIGAGIAGVGMGIMHDAAHSSYSKYPRVNRWLGYSMYLLGGFPRNWQYQHNTMHHGFTNIDGHDEDIDPGPVLRLSPHKPLLRVHRYQHLYAWFLYGLMTISWVTTKDFEQLNRYRKEGVKLPGNQSYTRMFVNLGIAKLIYYCAFILVPVIVLPFAWYWILIFFFAMHFTSGLILTTVFQTAHVVPTSAYPLPDQDGNLENNWAVHQLFTTSDFAPGNGLLSWLIGGLNYQIEHHLFPNISHVHYPEISKIVKETADKYKLPYYVQSGFLKAVYQHGKMLRMLGRSESLA